MPKKVLVSTVELFHRASRGRDKGLLGTEGLRLDWEAVIDRKDRLVAAWGAGKQESLEKRGIAILRGRGVFEDAHTLRASERTVHAAKVILATGSRPGRIPVPGADKALTSDEILDLRAFPSRIVVIGGGVIAMEFAFVFARAGAQVTVLEALPAILAGVDAELRAEVVRIGGDAGITILTNVKVLEIYERAVVAEVAGQRRSFEADRVLLAVGRPPNVEGMGLDAAGVAYDRRGIQVDPYLRSVSAPHVYAAGDAAGHFQRSPVAWYEGALAARNAVSGDREEADYTALPSTVFTIPSLSQVGLTEEESRARGLDVAISRSPFADVPAADILGETEGLTKMVYEATSGRILGVHVLGPHSEDLIEVAAVAVRAGLTRPQLGRLHYAFPNLAGSVVEAAIDY